MPPSRNKRVIVKDEQAINFKVLGLGQQLADTTMEDMPEGDLEISPAKRRKGEYSMQPKAVKARERALVEKFNAVESRLDNLLDRDNGIVVNCFTHAKEKSAPLNKDYEYTHLMKLRSDMPFVLVKEAMLTEGPYAGHVAIIIKQSLPFPLLELPKKIRTKVLNYLLKHDEKAIPMTLKQGGTKAPYSMAYAGKNNNAILATCKQLRDEAGEIVYNHQFHFPGTQVIASFLLQIGQFRGFLSSLRSDTYNASSARMMFGLLLEAPALQRLSFAHVSSNESPVTASKNIYNDAQAWLLALEKKGPAKALDIIRFDNAAFHVRDKDAKGNVTVIQWGEAEQIAFLKSLRSKLEVGGRRY